MTTSLTYFNFDGSRGLECRLALTVAGVAFEDKRIKREDWLTLKKSTPFGVLPILEESGRRIAQSNAILGYIGRKYDLHPPEPWDAARHEAIMLSVEELRHRMPSGQNDEETKTKRQEFANGWLKQWAESLESEVKGPYVDGDRLSVADIKLFVILRAFFAGTYDHIPSNFFAHYPKVKGLHDAVGEYPAITSYFESRG